MARNGLRKASASSFVTRISLEKRFFKGFAKPVNSFHGNACFTNGFGVSWSPPSSWPLAGLLLASCWPLAVLFLASCWPLGFLLASSSRKSVLQRARKTGEFSS